MLNIGYAYLLGREVRVGWLLGVVASVLGVWLYAVQDAWLMAALNVFYAVMGVYGWWNWGRATSDSGVSRYTLTKHVVALLLTGVGTACLVGLMHGAGMSGRHLGMEAFIAASAIVATWMMSHKVLENWLYWIVGDLVAVFYNHLIGYDIYAFLNVVYIGLAVLGFVRWRRELDQRAVLADAANVRS